jgi:hypothetical protein
MKAFPTEHPIAGTMSYHADGMDLRDYFAAQVLPKVMEKWPSTDFIGASEIAYEYADAMMKVR